MRGLVHDPSVRGGDIKPVGPRRCIGGYGDVATDLSGADHIVEDGGQSLAGGLVRECDNRAARLKAVPVTVKLTVVFRNPETGEGT